MYRTVPERDRITMEYVVVVGDTAQERAVGDPCRREEHVVAGAQLVRGQDRRQVVSAVDQGLSFLVVPGVQAALDAAAEAFQRGGGDDALRRPPDPHQH